MIRQCCRCKRIEISGHWVYPRFNQLEGQDITHGYCDVCVEETKKQIHQHGRQGRPMWKRLFQRFF